MYDDGRDGRKGVQMAREASIQTVGNKVTVFFGLYRDLRGELILSSVCSSKTYKTMAGAERAQAAWEAK